MTIKYSKLSNYYIKKILKKFCIELTATQTSKDLNLNRHTIDRYYTLFRIKIAEYQEKQKVKLNVNI